MGESESDRGSDLTAVDCGEAMVMTVGGVQGQCQFAWMRLQEGEGEGEKEKGEAKAVLQE